MSKTEISLPFITAGASGALHITQKMTRSQLEALVEPLIGLLGGLTDTLDGHTVAGKVDTGLLLELVDDVADDRCRPYRRPYGRPAYP
jgi:hypothetical protein